MYVVRDMYIVYGNKWIELDKREYKSYVIRRYLRFFLMNVNYFLGKNNVVIGYAWNIVFVI